MTIVGRKDDMIISGGENVHPAQVEAVLNEHPQVAESIVVGVPDERWGELVVAYVVRTDPQPRRRRAGTPHARPPDARGVQAPSGIPVRRADPAHRNRQEAPLQDPRAGARGRRRRPARTSVTSNTASADPVITGIGAVTPLGTRRPRDVAATARRRLRRRPDHAVRRLVHADPDRGRGQGFDGEQLMGTKRSRRSARFSQLAMAAAREAFADAGLQPAPGSSRSPTTSASAWSSTPPSPASRRPRPTSRPCCADGVRGVSPYYVPSMIPNMPACEVAIDLGLHGPVTASALACASGNAALLEARRLILTDEADVVLAGGTDAGISPVMFAGLANMGALSATTTSPSRRAVRSPQTVTASSTARALSCSWSSPPRTPAIAAPTSTRRRRRRSHHRRLPHQPPRPDRPAAAPGDAARARPHRYRSPPTSITSAAHGTATRINDAVETAVIRDVFGPAADELLVSSAEVDGRPHDRRRRRALGDGLRAGDARRRPAADDQPRAPDPACDLDYVPNVARRRPSRPRWSTRSGSADRTASSSCGRPEVPVEWRPEVLGEFHNPRLRNSTR